MVINVWDLLEWIVAIIAVALMTITIIKAIKRSKAQTPCEICNPRRNPLCTLECQEVCPMTKRYKNRC
jgi:hypothetical protein